MKVIDFLVELEKGNIPEKIIYHDCLFVYDSECKDYKNNNATWFFDNYIRDMSVLFQEIMIIDDGNNLSINKNDFDKIQEEINKIYEKIDNLREDIDKALRRSINNE